MIPVEVGDGIKARRDLPMVGRFQSLEDAGSTADWLGFVPRIACSRIFWKIFAFEMTELVAAMA